MYTISYLEESLEDLYEYLRNGYEPYKKLKWKIQLAEHVLEGDYEEWLDDMF